MLMCKFKDTDRSQFGAQIGVSSKTQMILHENGVWQGYPHSNRVPYQKWVRASAPPTGLKGKFRNGVGGKSICKKSAFLA